MPRQRPCKLTSGCDAWSVGALGSSIVSKLLKEPTRLYRPRSKHVAAAAERQSETRYGSVNLAFPAPFESANLPGMSRHSGCIPGKCSAVRPRKAGMCKSSPRRLHTLPRGHVVKAGARQVVATTVFLAHYKYTSEFLHGYLSVNNYWICLGWRIKERTKGTQQIDLKIRLQLKHLEIWCKLYYIYHPSVHQTANSHLQCLTYTVA